MSDTKIAYTFFANGRAESETERDQQGRRHGMTRWWWGNGEQKLSCPYHKSRPHGMEQFWYQNGKLELKRSWHHGQMHGIATSFLVDGKLNYKRYYILGMETTREKFAKEWSYTVPTSSIKEDCSCRWCSLEH